MAKKHVKEEKKGGFRKLKTFLKVCFTAFLLACIFFGVRYGAKLIEYKDYAKELVSDERVFKRAQTTIVYDKDGGIIANLCAEKDSYYLESKKIPYIIKKAFVITEDRKFYEHKGIDIKAIARAFVALIQNEGQVTQGGSTITQQLARNIFLSHEVSIERKIKEMFIAMELENTYSKDQILEFYINNIYFSNGLYGIEAAARGYFSKSVTDLSISQMLFLCAIPNNPTMYDPVKNLSSTVKRRNLIAKELYEQKEIDQTLYNQIINEEIQLCTGTEIKHDYVETFVRYCATIELMRARGFVFKNQFESDEEKDDYKKEYDDEYNYCNGLLFTGGYRIYTSIDMNKQETLQNILNDTLSRYEDVNDEGVYKFQGSATCIDNSTGYVIAIVGGRSQEHKGYTLNRAFQSFRQPGSSIKPLLVYTPIFERGYTPETKVMDERFDGGPENADKTYEGEMDIRNAVWKSKNTVAWKLFTDIGPYTAMPYLLSMNFSKIVKEDYVPAASLGGLTHGVSTYEMAAAYATLCNKGVYRNPTCIVKITDATGKMVWDNRENTHDTKIIYKENAAKMMTDVLKGVLTDGTGRRYNVENAVCAAKTGTTNNNFDSWFVGYSYYYTTAVWCGYDMPESMDDGYSSTCPGRIWQSYMTDLHRDLPVMDFAGYADNGTVNVHEESTKEESTAQENSDDINEENTDIDMQNPENEPETGDTSTENDIDRNESGSHTEESGTENDSGFNEDETTTAYSLY